MLGSRQQPIVYIDSENFLFKAIDILKRAKLISNRGDLTKFDFRGLLEDSLGRKDLLIRYYGTHLRVIKNNSKLKTQSRKIINDRRKMLSTLQKQQIEFVGSGNLKVRDGDACPDCKSKGLRLQEKGVDVRIAVDMVVDATNNRDLYLVSSDTDLLPAVKQSKVQEAKVVYVGFSERLTKALVAETSSAVVWQDKDIIKAFKDSQE